MRKLLLITMMLVLLAVFRVPVLATDNVVHYTITTSDTFSGSLEEAGIQQCVSYPGTITVREDTILHVTEFVDGPNAGRFHIVAELQAQLTITPDDPALGPAYSGTYHGTGRLTFKDQVNMIGPTTSALKLSATTAPGCDSTCTATPSDGMVSSSSRSTK